MAATSDRIAKRDVVIAVVVSALGVLLMYGNVTDPDVDASVFAIPLFLAVTVPVLWRRVAPLQAAAAVVGAVFLHEALFGTDVVRCGVVLPIAALLAFAAGSQLDGRDARFGLGLSLIPVAVEGVAFVGVFAVVFAGLTVGVWWIGRVVRSRSAMVSELRQRTDELREARDERARLEVTADRARLSGELDELLQRRLGELARLADQRPSDSAAATATLVDIEQESRSTLEEMRAVVRGLRDDTAQAPTTPQPALTELEALLVRAKGSDARLVVEGSPRVLPPGVELSAYRIVEHLLAALGDAPDVEVRVRFADDALELAVAGPARRRARAEIERARERVALQRGTLQATTRGKRAEAVVSLPVLAGA